MAKKKSKGGRPTIGKNPRQITIRIDEELEHRLDTIIAWTRKEMGTTFSRSEAIRYVLQKFVIT